jgi:iron-sulfur cluster repair protein YtfE (RIC family)
MHAEHGEHEEPLARLVALCARLVDNPQDLPAVARDLDGVAAELEAHFARHLAREEEIIFPAMRRLLDGPAGAQVLSEIRARRAPGF